MATNDKKPPADEPMARLTEESLKHIEGIDKELAKAEENIEALEELGFDTSVMRQKIEWGKKASEVIRRQFGVKK